MLGYKLLGSAQRKKKSRIVVQREEEEIRYSEVEKVNIQFNVVPPIKQIVCTFTGEGEKLY